MEQIPLDKIVINWEPIIWAISSVGGIIVILIGIIAYILKADREENKQYRLLFSNELKEQQREISQVTINTQLAVELIKHEQEFGKQRLESFISFVEQGKYKSKRK